MFLASIREVIRRTRRGNERSECIVAALNPLGRALFTRDDLLVEATQRQRAKIPFHGVIYAHQLRVSIGRCGQDLDIIAKAGEPEDLMHAIMFLPL
jgi:hypothetical protein